MDYIRVISRIDGYYCAGRKNPAHPVYFEPNYFTESEISQLLNKNYSPENQGPIIVDMDMPAPQGEGWIIHRAAERSGDQSKELINEGPMPVSLPENSSSIPERKRRGRPPTVKPTGTHTLKDSAPPA